MKASTLATIVVSLCLSGLVGCVSGSDQIAQSAVAIKNAGASITKNVGETRQLQDQSLVALSSTIQQTEAAKQDLDSVLSTEGRGHSQALASASEHLDGALEDGKAAQAKLQQASKPLDAALKTLSTVDQKVDQVVQALPTVEDQESQFSKNLQRVLRLVAIGAGIYALWYVGPFLRKGLNFLGQGIPKGTAAAAKMDVESLVEEDLPQSQRERIAVLRATDPAYAAAFKKNKAILSKSKKRKRK